jgi:hypothetical protein
MGFPTGCCLGGRERYVPCTEDPILAIWEAMNLIEKAQECSNIVDIPEILAKAEMVLSNVLKDLVQNANNLSSSRELSS